MPRAALKKAVHGPRKNTKKQAPKRGTKRAATVAAAAAATASSDDDKDTVYLEFRSESSAKFWSCTLSGKEILTRYGRLGTEGRTTVNTFETEEKAVAARDKRVKDKVKKGYVRVSSAATATAEGEEATAAAAPSAKKKQRTGGGDDASDWSGIAPALVKELKRLGATCKAPPATPRSKTIEWENAADTEGAEEHVTVVLNEAWHRLLDDVVFPKQDGWKHADDEEYGFTWEFGGGAIGTELSDALAIPSVWFAVKGGGNWFGCIDVRSNPADPDFLDVDHELGWEIDEYEPVPFSKFCEGLTVIPEGEGED